MTAFYTMLSSLFELFAIALLIYGYMHEEKVIARENKFIGKVKRFIRKSLKSNSRFMAWLNKPQKHGKPDADFIAGQIKVFGDVWR